MNIEKAPSAGEIDLRAIAAVLRRQSRVIAYTVVLIFGLAGLFLIAVTPHFTATALILVDPDAKNLMESSSGASSSASANNARVDSEVEILRSSAVALEVITDQDLVTDQEFSPRLRISERLAQAIGIAHAASSDSAEQAMQTLARFKDAVTVRRKGLTYLISVEVSSKSPQRAAELANSLSRVYIEQQVEAKITSALAARDVMSNQIADARQTLSNYELEFDGFFQKNIAQISSENGEMSAKNSQLSARQSDIEAKSQLNAQLSLLLEDEDWASIADTLSDQTILLLESERQDLLDDFVRTKSQQNDASIELALNQIEEQLKQKTRIEIDGLALEVKNLVQSASALNRELRATYLDQKLPVDLLTEIYGLQQESTIARDQYQALLSRARELQTQAGVQMANSRIVSPALAPISPTFPNKNLVLLVALAASAGLGVGLAFLNEFYIGGVTSTLQLSELLQTSAVVTIPLSKEANTGRLSVAEKIVDAPLSIYSESLRTLRATLDQSFRTAQNVNALAGLNSGKIVLVTSSFAEEGKTTTALALARTYALAGKKTLLIDADLRRPSLHRHVGFAPKFGFFDYLCDPEKAGQDNAFYARDTASNLALIMGARRSEAATDQLLNTPAFEALMHQTRDVYDVTIIDSPPVLQVVDARYIAHHVDAVVMLVKWAVTSQSDIRAAALPLRAAMRSDAAFVPVLSQCDLRLQSAKYGDYYGAYSAAI